MEGMLELLSTTDAAVKALDRSSRSQSSTSSRASSGHKKSREQTESHDSGIVKSEQKSHGADPTHPIEGGEAWERSSDVSTTASDVLIRSTLGDPNERSLLEEKSQQDGAKDASNLSKCSKSSFGIDNFNSSGPQKIKISSKRLREIKSPYESPRDELQMTDGNGKALNGAPGLPSDRSDKALNGAPVPTSARSSKNSTTGSSPPQSARSSLHSAGAINQSQNAGGSRHSSTAGSRPQSAASSRHTQSSQPKSGNIQQPLSSNYLPLSGASSKHSSVAGSRPQSGGSQRQGSVGLGSRPSSGGSSRGRNKGQTTLGEVTGEISQSSGPITNNPKDIITLQSTPQSKKTTKRTVTPPRVDIHVDLEAHIHSPPVHDIEDGLEKRIVIERHTPQKHQSKVFRNAEDSDRLTADKLKQKLDLSLESQSQDSKDNSIHTASSSQPEIVTVPERIVTVSAQNSVSTDNSVSDAGSENIQTIREKVITISTQPPMSDDVSTNGDTSEDLDEKIPPALMDRFLHGQKTQGPSLKQGSQADRTSDKKSSAEVMVSDFKLSDKQRLIKQSFAKRYEQAGPKKRVIQPKIIGHQRSGSDVPSKVTISGPSGQTTEAVTAAVAASAAIAVTQPFLKAQQDLETKMADILGKIAELHSKQPGAPESTQEQQKITELETKLAGLTEQRIKQLEEQVAMQAQLLSMRRSPQSVQSIPISQSRSKSPVIRLPSRSPPRVSDSRPLSQSPPLQRKVDAPRAAFSKTKFSKPSQVHQRPDYEEWRKVHRSESEPRLQSPLDTPNPRSRAPKPVAYESAKEKKSKGILEEILASDASPRRDVPAPTAQDPKRNVTSQVGPLSPAVKKADDLVNELVDIKNEMNHVLSDADIWKSIQEKKLKELKDEKAKVEELQGPSPLDPYLLPSSVELTSPYKTIPDLSPRRYNAPLLPGFSEAREVLHEVKVNKAYLEANLEAVLRSRKEAEVYSVMENMYNESNTELARIRKMVDKKVAVLRSQVEREVTDDVVISEMRKNQPRVILNTSTAPPPAQRGMGRDRVGARIDTGLSKIKGPSFGPPLVSKTAGKENAETARSGPARPPVVKQPKVRSVFEDEEYMTSVYGKGSHQKGRTTVKNPYLHYQNVPKQKVERPPAAPDTKDAHLVKSAKTQTGPGIKQFYFSPTHGTYIPVTSSSAPIPGQLIPMAVPLGGPRMEGGLTEAVAIETPTGPVTSTPASKPQVTAAKNVTMVSYPAQDDLHGRPEPELAKQVLPGVDIDTDISDASPILSKTSRPSRSSPVREPSHPSLSPPSKELSRPSKSPSRAGSKSPSRRSEGGESPRLPGRQPQGVVHVQSPQQSPSKRKMEEAREDEDESTLTDVSEEDVGPESAPGIALPGYHPLSPPPESRTKEQDLPPRLAQMLTQTMDVLDEDIRRRELLENRAVEWIEQELMSRIISEMPEIRNPPPAPPRELGHEAMDESEDSMADEKEQSMFMMDCIGRAGLQIFVDAGVPVDSELVNALIKEALEEKVAGMLGQRPAEEGRLAEQRAHGKLSSAVDADKVQETYNILEEEEEYRAHQIATPQPTPKHTPITSPVRVISPPVTPPLSPVRTPRVEPVGLPQPAAEYVESEPESASIDISEEIRNLQAKLVQPTSASPTHEVHDVITPVPTPVPEPSPEPEPEPEVHRVPTPPLPTPREEKGVQVREPVEPVVVVPQVEQKVVKPEVVAPPKSESPIPEERPELTETTEEEQPQPKVITVEPPVMVDRPVSPIKMESPEHRTSPAPSETESITESSISDTIGQSVSEGQWLLNKSEGEIADFPIDEVEKIKLIHAAKQRAEISTASTMRGTEELQDESTEFPISEGEFQYKPSILPERDPLLLLMSKFQHAPVQPGQFDMTSDQVADFLDHTGKSAGELSLHQLEKSMGEVRYVRSQGRKGRASPDRYDRRSPSPHKGRRSPEGGYGHDRRGRVTPERDEYDRDYMGGRGSPGQGRRSPGQGRRSPGQGQRSPGQGRRSPERDQTYGRKSPSRDRYSPERDVNNGSRSPTRGRRSLDRDVRRSPTVSFDDEVNGRGRESPSRGRQSPGRDAERYYIETTTTTTTTRRQQSPSGPARPTGQGRRTPTKPSTPGGVSLGGSLTGGRTSPLKSSLRKPPISQGVPEKSVTMSGTRTFNVRGSDDNALSMSDRGTRTFTPDQMNMEELLQSGYLTQTFSDQSQGGNSLRSSRGSQGISTERQRKKGKSLGLTYSFESESESELKRLAESGSLKMSVTLPSTGEMEESGSYGGGYGSYGGGYM